MSETRRFFISHKSSSDKLPAMRLKEALEEFSVTEVWLDLFELAPGDSLTKIESAIEEYDVLLALWSEQTEASEWVKREIQLAERSDVHIVPCVMDRSDVERFPSLSERIFIDYSIPEFGFGRLCLSEIMPYVLDDPGADRLLREHNGQLGFLMSQLHDPEFMDHDEWKTRLDKTWDRLRTLVEEQKERRPETAGDCDAFVRHMAALEETLMPILKNESYLQHIDLGDYIDDQGNLVIPAGGFGPPPQGGPQSDDPVAGAKQELRDALQNAVPAAQLDQAVDLVHRYIFSARSTLETLNRLAQQTGSAAGRQIVGQLDHYLTNPHDLVPEAQYGTFGLVDDAFLIHNTAYRIAEAGLVQPTAFSVDWQAIATADGIIRSVLPANVIMQMESVIAQYVGMLWQERQAAYTPQVAQFGGQNALLMNLLGNLFR